MSSLWPWLAIAGAGALHGLHPASGWLFATTWSVRSHDRTQTWRALASIAVGHVAALALGAVTIVLGLMVNRAMLQVLAAVLLITVVAYRFSHYRTKQSYAPANHVGLALWSFMMATAHGAGLMLMPALIPFCVENTPTHPITTSDSLLLAFAAVGIHTTAMLVVTGVIASVACRSVSAGARMLRRRRSTSS